MERLFARARADTTEAHPAEAIGTGSVSWNPRCVHVRAHASRYRNTNCTAHTTFVVATPRWALFCGPWRLQHGLVQDMQKSGAPLAKICNAGPWRSNAVIRYLDECELEEDVALEAALHVEDEEWID